MVHTILMNESPSLSVVQTLNMEPGSVYLGIRLDDSRLVNTECVHGDVDAICLYLPTTVDVDRVTTEGQTRPTRAGNNKRASALHNHAVEVDRVSFTALLLPVTGQPRSSLY